MLYEVVEVHKDFGPWENAHLFTDFLITQIFRFKDRLLSHLVKADANFKFALPLCNRFSFMEVVDSRQSCFTYECSDPIAVIAWRGTGEISPKNILEVKVKTYDMSRSKTYLTFHKKKACTDGGRTLGRSFY